MEDPIDFQAMATEQKSCAETQKLIAGPTALTISFQTVGGERLHCPKTFQQKFMLTRVTPNRAYFKSLYRAKNPYFASVKNLCCI
jgi:hypothetical protein